MPFFGPGVAVTASAEEFDQIQRSPALLQRPNENLTNGASADGALQATPKRSRRSNGATNGRTKSGEGMDVGDGGCYPKPAVAEFKLSTTQALRVSWTMKWFSTDMRMAAMPQPLILRG